VSFLELERPASMTPPPLPHPIDPALEDTLAAVETRLAALGEALRARDAAAIDSHATELHRALARAVDHFTHAARSGAVPHTLRRRLASASGQVAAQRESLARATAALDRAIEVLMPRDTPGLYSSIGAAERGLRSGGSIQA
jgi:ABC-type transporter Mla subunit MlaD